ncbi:MAG TPA: PaREP1 family protein, partial [Dehalococcoidia bacterium]|nr:PaREP1 family protein [Dehalococcoidia bacterium]
GEAGKAGELLGGSVAQALYAVAAYTNTPVKTHRALKNFAIQLARDLGDQTIEIDFVVAESLHHNFYDVQQEPQDIEIVIPVVQELVSKLLNLIPGELATSR